MAEPDGDGLRVIDSFSRIVRLGEGLAFSDRLSAAAMARTLAALRVCGQVMGRNRVTRSRSVATAACRRAANGAEFVRRARRATGIELEVLSEGDEARLAMLGCMPLVEPAADQVLMLDIGGGSTELFWVDRRLPADGAEPGHVLSLPLGVVTLSEGFGPARGQDGYDAMVRHVFQRLTQDGRARHLAARSEPARMQMIGTSGTVTTLAAVHLGLRRYDRRRVDGLSMAFTDLEVVAAELRALDDAARAAHPCIGRGRADLVVAGCAILEAVHRLWPVERLRVADRGIREGILSELNGQTLRAALDGGRAALHGGNGR